jgi:hypothetical protein
MPKPIPRVEPGIMGTQTKKFSAFDGFSVVIEGGAQPISAFADTGNSPSSIDSQRYGDRFGL